MIISFLSETEDASITVAEMVEVTNRAWLPSDRVEANLNELVDAGRAYSAGGGADRRFWR